MSVIVGQMACLFRADFSAIIEVTMTKEIYIAPTVESVGSFEEITQSTNSGTNVDAAFDGVSILDSIS